MIMKLVSSLLLWFFSFICLQPGTQQNIQIFFKNMFLKDFKISKLGTKYKKIT